MDHLESTRQLLTAEQLKAAVHHDVVDNAELRHQLQQNLKVSVHADGKYQYKVSRPAMHRSHLADRD